MESADSSSTFNQKTILPRQFLSLFFNLGLNFFPSITIAMFLKHISIEKIQEEFGKRPFLQNFIPVTPEDYIMCILFQIIPDEDLPNKKSDRNIIPWDSTPERIIPWLKQIKKFW